ncbi:uncharacterized protein LOC124816568 isoform X2 [Hydra vulgaris]|uniref:uncharacterized protein LOC124816568 isoform X2 n=1 Tax=Hydra vulgaris TaxID=6087 RepID=UPI0032EA11DB
MAFSKVKWIEPHANGSSKIQYGTVPTNWIEEEEGQEFIRWPCNAKDVEPYIKRCQNPGINWLFFVLVQHFGSADSYINCESIKTCSESESDHNSQLGKRKYNQIDSFAYQKQSEKRLANARKSKTKKLSYIKTSDDEVSFSSTPFPKLDDNGSSCVYSYNNSATISSSEGLIMAFSKVKWIEPHANGSSKIQYGTVPTNWIEEEEGQEFIRWPCNAKDVEPYIKRCQNPGINWLFFVLVQHFGSADSYINCESIKTCSESESDHNSQLGKRKYNQIDSFAYQKQSEKRLANARKSKTKKLTYIKTSDDEVSFSSTPFPKLDDNGSSCVYSYNNSATISSSEGLIMAFSKVKWIEPHANGSSKIQYGTVPTNWIEEEEGQEFIRWPCNAKDVEPYIKRCQNPGINWLFFVLVQHFGSADSYINCESIKTCSESESDHNSQLGKRKYNQIDSFAYQKQSEKRLANARKSKTKKLTYIKTSDDEVSFSSTPFPKLDDNGSSCVYSYNNSATISSSEGLTCEKIINKENGKSAGETDKDYISDQTCVN